MAELEILPAIQIQAGLPERAISMHIVSPSLLTCSDGNLPPIQHFAPVELGKNVGLANAKF